MKEVILEILKRITEDDDEDRMKIEVGKLDDDLIQKLHKMKKEKIRIKEEMELKAREIELRFKREIEDVMEPLQEKADELHKYFWEAVYEKNGLDPKHDYNVSVKERKVYQYVDIPQSENRFMQ